MSRTRNFDAAYAVVRLDFESVRVDVDELEDIVTVKGIVWDQATAEAEIERLNAINADKGCLYVWQYTRVEPREARDHRAH